MSLINRLCRGPVIIVARNISKVDGNNSSRGPIIVARLNSTRADASNLSRGPIIVARQFSTKLEHKGPVIIVAKNNSSIAVTFSKASTAKVDIGNPSRGPIIVAREGSITLGNKSPILTIARNNSTAANTCFKASTITHLNSWPRGPVIIVARHNSTKPDIHSIIRVDHAGELGADRIYAGQMAVLGQTSKGALIQHMWDQEKRHRAKFEELIRKHRVRPTVMTPIWNVMAFALGAGSALLGEKAAMACTVAVETVIVDHYNDQLRDLTENPTENRELMDAIKEFRDEEQEHHDTGIDHGAEQAPFYRVLSETIKFGCKAAISISKVV